MRDQGRDESTPAFECRPGAEYDEPCFRYFLAIDRARAKRFDHPLCVLIATLEPVPGQPVEIPRTKAASLFKALRLSLRETDVMGWYREGLIAGAVLASRVESSGFEPAGTIEQRVGEWLRQLLPARIARGLKVRVIELSPSRLGTA